MQIQKKAFAKIFMVKHHGFVWGVQTEKEQASLTESAMNIIYNWNFAQIKYNMNLKVISKLCRFLGHVILHMYKTWRRMMQL